MEPPLKPLRILLCCIAFSLSASGFAHALTLTLVPADTTVAPGDGVTLRLVADAAPDFKACSLMLGFTTPRLTFVSANAGDVLNSSGGFTQFVLPDVVAPSGSIGYDAAVLLGTGSSPGVVVFVSFTANTVGNASVECLSATVRDTNNQPILPPCSTSAIHVIGPVTTRKTRWSTLKSIYR